MFSAQLTGPAVAEAGLGGQTVSAGWQILLPVAVAESDTCGQSPAVTVKGPLVMDWCPLRPSVPTVISCAPFLVLLSWMTTPVSGTLPVLVTTNTSIYESPGTRSLPPTG